MSMLEKLVLAGALLLPIGAQAKGNGDGVGFWMEGTVTNVSVSGQAIQFHLTGGFWLVQHHSITNRSAVEVRPKDGFSATVSDPDSFFAMTRDWTGGSPRQRGDLLKILKAAEGRGTSVRFELMQPQMDFGLHQTGFVLMDAKVLRVTDADLR